MVKKFIAVAFVAVLSVAATTTVLASSNYYVHNGPDLGYNGNWGQWLCYRGGNDYLGLVSFYDSTGDGTLGMFDGQGTCLEEMPGDVGMDIGSRVGPVMFWSGDQSGVGTYKWSIRQDGSLVRLNGTGSIGVEGGFAHFGNPTVYAEDVRVAPGEESSWSLVDKIIDLEARIEALEAE